MARGRRLAPVTLATRISLPTRAALALIAIHLAVRAWLMVPGEYWQDDFAFLRRARAEPLSLDYLFHVHNGHVIPVPFLLTWLAAHVHSYLPAALIMLALQALASVALWLMLRSVVGASPAMLVALALALFTPLMFTTVTWWAAGVMMLGMQIAMALAAHAHVAFQRTRRWYWLTAAVAALLLGLAFWEKAVLVPAFLVLVTTLVSGTPRQTMRTLLRLWPAWLAYAAVSGAYLLAYVHGASVGQGQARSVHGVVSLARHQVVDVFLRGLLGGPWHGIGSPNATWLEGSAFGLVVLAQLLVAFTVLSYRISGPRTLVAWAALLLYLLLDLALTARGRGLFFVFVQMDPRYVCDAVPVAALCVAVMLTAPPGRTVGLPSWLTSHAWVAAFAATLLIFNSAMVTATLMAPALHRHQVSSYVAHARSSLAKDPHVVLYDGFVPGSIMIGAFPARDKRVSTVLDAYAVKARYDRPSEDMAMLDDSGVVRPFRLAFAQTGEINSADACGVRLDSEHPQAVVPLDTAIPEGDWVMRLDYFAGSDAVVDVVTAGEPQPVGLVAGRRSLYIPVKGGTAAVELIWRSGDNTVCTSGLTVGLPVPSTS